MAKQRNTPLQTKYQQLPKSVVLKKDILPDLEKVGISARTFDRDRNSNPNNIPHGRLAVYAALFNCDVSELIDGFSKIKTPKPILGGSLAKKAGLRTSTD
jgi:hypothetical protein